MGSSRAMGYWHPSHSRPSAKTRSYKNGWKLYMVGAYCLPAFLVIVGNHPDVQRSFLNYWQALVYPPRSDFKIVQDIYAGKAPSGSSMDSYEKENQKTVAQMDKRGWTGYNENTKKTYSESEDFLVEAD